MTAPSADLPARYGLTGEWGGNFIAGADEARRFDEYPRSKRLLRLKKELLARLSHRPLFLPLATLRQTSTDVGDDLAAAQESPVPGASPTASSWASTPTLLSSRPAHSDGSSVLRPFNSHLLATLGQARFDTVVITPPPDLSWAEVAALPIRQLTADPAFVYLWVGQGSADGLEKGREALSRWGFRRCEEIVWVKTNKSAVRGSGADGPTDSVFTNTKEHCLMGIRGTVRRSTDGRLVHTNIDTDIIVWENNSDEPHAKPPELYSLAENFSTGTRRLDLFGLPTRPRDGWVTANWGTAASMDQVASSGKASEASTVSRLESIAAAADSYAAVEAKPSPITDGFELFDKDTYDALVRIDGRYLYPTTEEVENLRPKSPVRNGSSGPSRPQSSQYSSGAGTSAPGHRPYIPIAASNVPGFASLPLPPRPVGLSTGTQARSVSQQPQQRSPLPPPPPPPTQQQGFAFGNSAAGVDVYAAMGGMLPFPGAYGLPMMSPLGAFFQPSAFGMGMTTPAGMMNQAGMQGMYATSSFGGSMQQQFYQQGSMPSMIQPQMSTTPVAVVSADPDDSDSTSSSATPPPPPLPSTSVPYAYSYNPRSTGWGGPR